MMSINVYLKIKVKPKPAVFRRAGEFTCGWFSSTIKQQSSKQNHHTPRYSEHNDDHSPGVTVLFHTISCSDEINTNQNVHESEKRSKIEPREHM